MPWNSIVLTLLLHPAYLLRIDSLYINPFYSQVMVKKGHYHNGNIQ